jgi:hypothetical protein
MGYCSGIHKRLWGKGLRFTLSRVVKDGRRQQLAFSQLLRVCTVAVPRLSADALQHGSGQVSSWALVVYIHPFQTLSGPYLVICPFTEPTFVGLSTAGPKTDRVFASDNRLPLCSSACTGRWPHFMFVRDVQDRHMRPVPIPNPGKSISAGGALALVPGKGPSSQNTRRRRAFRKG